MKIAVVKENKPRENRVAITPDVVKAIIKKGFDCIVESNAGINSNYSDINYSQAGAVIFNQRSDLFAQADVVLAVNAPNKEDIENMRPGSVLISFIYHLFNPEFVEICSNQKISAFSMDAVPRISRAQKMDALSSQSNLAGYKTIILGANALGKIFPMMMTAAGTITPAKVMIMGAGVAGLQAVATAKRLGAIVEVSDIRPETKEQVESLGGRFIEVETDEDMRGTGGYAKEASKEFLEKQQALIAKHVSDADIVVTTALVPGKKAPRLITEAMVKSMKPGSVIVDMAVEQGGNCELSELNKTVNKHGVNIIGESNLPSLLPVNASELYAKNITALLFHLAEKEAFKWELDEEVTAGSLIVHEGKKMKEAPPVLERKPA